MEHLLLICVVYFFNFPLVHCLNKLGYCMQPNSTVINCCTGFYKSGENCLECDSGYIGPNCSLTCPHGYFGRQCREFCDCSPDKYCDAAIGCLCNSTSVNCADLEREMTEATRKDYTDDASLMSVTGTRYLEETIVPVSIFVLAVLIIGTVCIRIWYTKTIKKRQDEVLSPHNVADVDSRTQRSTTEGLDNCDNRLSLRVKYKNHFVGHTENLTTSGGPSYCSRPTLDESSHPSQQSKKNPHINKFSPCTVCKKNNEELETHIGKTHDQNTDQNSYIYSTPSKHPRKQPRSNNSEQKQQKTCRRTLKPKFPEPVHDTILHEQNSGTKLQTCSSGIHDEEMYANNCDMEYSNRCLRRDNSIDEDSNEYFDVRYDGKMTMSFNQINKSDRSEPSSSETCPDLTEYIHCGLAKGYNVQ